MFPHFLFIGYDLFFDSAIFIFCSFNKDIIHNPIVEILWTLGEACSTMYESFMFYTSNFILKYHG